MTARVRPEFAHMAAAMRHMATGYDNSSQPDIAAEFRYRADLLTLPDLCACCGQNPTEGEAESFGMQLGRESIALTAEAVEELRDFLTKHRVPRDTT